MRTPHHCLLLYPSWYPHLPRPGCCYLLPIEEIHWRGAGQLAMEIWSHYGQKHLVIYGQAYVPALTSENIKSVFKKTGIWPFNPSVVTEEMLAPSKKTSSEAYLPISPDDPAVNILAIMLRKLATISEAEDTPDIISETPVAGPSNPTKHDVINEAVNGLSQTKLAHLIASTLTTSKDAMPKTLTQTIICSKPSPLLAIQPKTETEILLLAALQELQMNNETLADRNIALQATNIPMKHVKILRKSNKPQQRKRRRERTTVPHGKRPRRSGRKLRMNTLHWRLGKM